MTTTLALIINAGLAAATVTGLALMTRIGNVGSHAATRDAFPHGVPLPANVLLVRSARGGRPRHR